MSLLGLALVVKHPIESISSFGRSLLNASMKQAPAAGLNVVLQAGVHLLMLLRKRSYSEPASQLGSIARTGGDGIVRKSSSSRVREKQASVPWGLYQAADFTGQPLHSLHLELVLSKTRQQFASGLTILLHAIHSGFIEDSQWIHSGDVTCSALVSLLVKGFMSSLLKLIRWAAN
jgi:hypothetical protein